LPECKWDICGLKKCEGSVLVHRFRKEYNYGQGGTGS
jgi:hypothetical protein